MTAADLIATLPDEVRSYLDQFGHDWGDIPMPAMMERHKAISGALVLQHLHNAQDYVVRAIEGEEEFDDTTYEAITNYAAESIFHLKAVLLLMVLLEHRGQHF